LVSVEALMSRIEAGTKTLQNFKGVQELVDKDIRVLKKSREILFEELKDLESKKRTEEAAVLELSSRRESLQEEVERLENSLETSQLKMDRQTDNNQSVARIVYLSVGFLSVL
jgi:chromosome segregation ATPase